jgi:hypothetical protein
VSQISIKPGASANYQPSDARESLADPLATRAVGAANGKTQSQSWLSAIPSSGVGKLICFAGALDAKAHLLALEKRDRKVFRKREIAAVDVTLVTTK